MIEDARLAKLPVWAQDEIARLRAGEEAWKREREAILLAKCGAVSQAVIMKYDGERLAGLPTNAFVRFQIGGKVDEYIDVRRDREYNGVSVRCANGILVTQHHSSNGVIARIMAWPEGRVL